MPRWQAALIAHLWCTFMVVMSRLSSPPESRWKEGQTFRSCQGSIAGHSSRTRDPGKGMGTWQGHGCT
eukprot:8389615-Alexandrium_andersonii.AAC.1